MLLRQGVNKLVFFVFISHQIDRNFRTVVLLTEIVIPKSSAAESRVDYKYFWNCRRIRKLIWRTKITQPQPAPPRQSQNFCPQRQRRTNLTAQVQPGQSCEQDAFPLSYRPNTTPNSYRITFPPSGNFRPRLVRVPKSSMGKFGAVLRWFRWCEFRRRLGVRW